MRSELARVEADATDPLGYEVIILSRAQGPVRVSASWDQVFADFAIGPTKVVVQGLAIVAIPIVALTGDPVSGGLAPVWRQLQRDGV